LRNWVAPTVPNWPILNGTNPGDIPYYQVTRYELALNLKTAKSLGIEFPVTLLGSADFIIE
jgi:ABC-type uncharacterized transport system substrate-binding protein